MITSGSMMLRQGEDYFQVACFWSDQKCKKKKKKKEKKKKERKEKKKKIKRNKK